MLGISGNITAARAIRAVGYITAVRYVYSAVNTLDIGRTMSEGGG